MPDGTTIRISGFGGGETYEVPNNTAEPYPLSAFLSDETDESGRLTIEVTSVGLTTIFAWPFQNAVTAAN